MDYSAPENFCLVFFCLGAVKVGFILPERSPQLNSVYDVLIQTLKT